ncbi:MAG: haloacid dehalogenase [Acidimicrobiales bacterium]|nr:MAG: haloacid dehalogenase [Acidimicrobiales bacterium]
MISEALADKTILVTGATGFLGTAVVERLLRRVPGCRLVLLVRPGRRSTAERRAQREIFANDAFDPLRSELGEDGFRRMIAERVVTVAGDVSSDGLGLDEQASSLLPEVDVVIHSAATVSFDSPLDVAVEVNLLGPTRVAETLGRAGASPHLVAVSTCYVAGSRRGSAAEEHVADSPFFPDVDWRGEVEAARRARRAAEDESRTPEMLARFRRKAHRELGAAGTPLLARRTEQLRQQWVSDRMVEAGRSRAASLGWPDAYAYTKALGEKALVETRGELPLTIVRPSIIESALSEPSPGWIRGFRMAEPVIISFARGLLREFPGVPEGIVDVIPVDMVSAAICAVAARGPLAEPDVVQVASGSVNPLRYRRLVDLVSGYFTEKPLYDSHGQPIEVPKWSFPGRGRVERQLLRATSLLQRLETTVQALPLRGAAAEMSARLEERRKQAEQALDYVRLYGAYAECEAVYGVDRLLELWESLPEEDRAAFDFDPRHVDWSYYVREIHLPSVVRQARVGASPSGRAASRTERLRARVLSPDRQMAVFDLENTLVSSNVVSTYAWLATRRLAGSDRLRFVLRSLAEVPSLLAMDRRDRSDFLRHFYRRYEGAPVDELSADALELLSEHFLANCYPAAIRRVREHRRAGHKTVLITGALDFVVEPLRPLFDHIVCARMSVRDGEYTGELAEVPPTGEARAQILAELAEAEGVDLEESVAYADSSSDLPMLEAVGFPVAVNPETKLAAMARRRGWLVEDFRPAAGAPRPLLPLAEGPPRRESWPTRLAAKVMGRLERLEVTGS